MDIKIYDQFFAYGYDTDSLSKIFFLPTLNPKDEFLIFWPGVISIIPFFGFSPIYTRAGQVQTTFGAEIIDSTKKHSVTTEAAEKYSMFIYGIYRTEEIEEATLISIENVLADFTQKIIELK